jgi:hypothetical protein
VNAFDGQTAFRLLRDPLTVLSSLRCRLETRPFSGTQTVEPVFRSISPRTVTKEPLMQLKPACHHEKAGLNVEETL